MDLFALQFAMYAIGGLSLAVIVYASWLLYKANKHRAAIKQSEYRTKAFDNLYYAVPGFIIGIMAAIIYWTPTADMMTIVIVAIVGVASIGSFFWFFRKYRRAAEEYGSSIVLEDEAMRLRDED